MSSDLVVVPPRINANDRGPIPIIVGGIMLSFVILMLGVTSWNRYGSKTLFMLDSYGFLLGGGLAITFFAMWAVAVERGFGHHKNVLSDGDETFLQRLTHASIFVFFFSHGVVKLAYNSLARRTGRGKGYKTCIDVFSAFIGLWTLVNLIVIAVSIGQKRSPSRIFFWISGVFSILIVIGQLVAFLWIIWRTMTTVRKKIEWTISMGIFVPFCVAVIIGRLIFTPVDYYAGDWTFNDAQPATWLLAELNVVTLTILAPNLPTFFDKTSTGCIFYLPGEVESQSKAERRRRQITMNAGHVCQTRNRKTQGTDPPRITAGPRALAQDRYVVRDQREDVVMVRHSIEVERNSSSGSSLEAGPPHPDGLMSFKDMFD